MRVGVGAVRLQKTPVMNLPLSTIREAQQLLRRYLPVTRLVPASSLSRRTGAHVYLKLESELPTGSFKPRGALYALWLNLKRGPVREVTASSTGNHGAAVAYAAQLLGIPATIFLPESPNPVKRARIAELGASIVEGGRDITDAFHQASAYAHSRGACFLNDATDPDLPAGPAVIACEILEQLPETDTLYVPMGDTALIRGVAAAAKQISPKIRVIGVQARGAPSYVLSWQQGKVVVTETCATVADGLATRRPEAENVAAIRALVDEVCLVTDEQMLAALGHLLFEERIVAEPSGAATTAAVLQEGIPVGRQLVLLVSGANLSPEVLRRAIGQKD
jgi:threonine dehydratase